MKHKLQRKRARRRARAPALRNKIKTKHARVLAAFRMGIVEWDETDDAYYIGDQDVTKAMRALSSDANVFGECKLRNPRYSFGVKWVVN